MRAILLGVVLLADASAPARGLDPRRCGLQKTVAPGAGPLVGVEFSPDGRLLAVAGSDGTVRLLDTASWREAARIQPPDGVSSVAFGPGGATLAAGGPTGRITLYDAASAKVLRTFEGGSTLAVLRLAFAPGGKTVAAGGMDGALGVWDVESGRRLRTLEVHADPVVAVAVSRGRVAAGGGGLVKVWNPGSWEMERTFAVFVGKVTALAFSPAGNRLAAGDSEHRVRVWSLETGREERVFEGHEGSVTGVAFTADGRHLVSASDDRTVRIWDVAGGAEAARLRHHWEAIHGLAVHPRGASFATAGADRMVKIWGRVPDVAASLRPRGIAGIWGDAAPGGVVMTTVSGDGGAGRAGLRQGDLVKSVGGREVRVFEDAADAIQSRYGGEGVDFVIQRNGAEQTLRVTLGDWPASE